MSTEEKQPFGMRAVHKAARILAPFAGLILVIALFQFLTRDAPGVYLSVENLKTIAVQTAIIATCGVGMTLIIVGGGIDLSVGSAVALVAVIAALVFNGEFYATLLANVFLGKTSLAWATAAVLSACLFASRWKSTGFGWAVASVAVAWLVGWGVFHSQGGLAAVLAGALAGTLLGWINGLLITTTRVVPFIITLGMMEVFRGAAQLLADGESVPQNFDVSGKNEWLADLVGWQLHNDWVFELMHADPKPGLLLSLLPAPIDDLLSTGPGIWLMIVTGVAASVILWKMRLGRYILALGSNERAAVLSGIRAPQVKLWMYSLAGLATGLAGVMTFSRLNYGSSTAAAGLELDVIAAVVIGGGSLRGGEGSVLGTFIGAFIMGFMRNGCVLAGIPTSVQRILIGSIIVLAVALDEWRHRRPA